MGLFNQVVDVMKIVETISAQLGSPITKDDYEIEDLGCPHVAPKKLKKGYAAVYMFANDDNWLKIGKANEKSNARFTYQHYRISNHVSSLSKSLSNDNFYIKLGFSSNSPREWVEKNTYRINILLKAEKGRAATALVEAILHYKFMPKYEKSIYR